MLVQVGICHSVNDVPEHARELLQRCNKKSDPSVERDILDKFLMTTKMAIEE